ncbi:hypothetical protein RHMOL_Rhmol02G0258500 [Rhododendron molle]|uniref:Uncharacterized protein n=1 Tax=Rhododendron molle TaxID=49168 RepID=A0ACC0PUM7_RHOML|nr:hypothetical protein RHMOL_Rhmol02G0258500 [Rhododendron molle]
MVFEFLFLTFEYFLFPYENTFYDCLLIEVVWREKFYGAGWVRATWCRAPSRSFQTCFGWFKFVWVIFKCKITESPPQSQIDLGHLKHVRTAEMRTCVARARSALKNFSCGDVI